jgi:hypothetical protein
MIRSLSMLVLLPALAVAWAQGADDADDATPAYDPSLDYAQVTFVEVTVGSEGRLRFDVTVRHDDEGWDHYADAWQVVDPATGEILGTRELLHPHVNEQPFTRSLRGVAVPEGVSHVVVRARCNVHGFGGREVRVDLATEEGPGYVVRR